MRRDEEGFTLIELLVSTVILAIIMPALAASFIIMLRNSGETQQRLSESHDAQMTATYFATDVQGARDVEVATPQCGAEGTAFATFTGPSGVAVGTDTATTYTVVVTAEGRELQRVHNGKTHVVAHELAPCGAAGTPDPAVAISPTCPGACGSSYVLRIKDESGYEFEVIGKRRLT